MFSGITPFRRAPTLPPQAPPPVAVKPWGCHDKPRKDGYWGRNLFRDKGEAFPPVEGWVWIEDNGTRECQYRIATPTDPRCAGCTSP